jgi:Sigma-70 region 2
MQTDVRVCAAVSKNNVRCKPFRTSTSCGIETVACKSLQVSDLSLNGPMDLPNDTPNPPHVLRYAELAPLPDETLMAHLRVGHHDALGVLFDRYHRLVLNVALRILRDAGEAEDLMQLVFLEVFRHAAQFDAAKGTTKVWIPQFAYHRSFNRRQYLNLRGMRRVARTASNGYAPGL